MKWNVGLICVMLVSAMWVSCGHDGPEGPQEPDTPVGTEKPDTPSEPEEPVDPSQLPQADWEFSFNDYRDTPSTRDFYNDDKDVIYRKVVIARDGRDLYVKGIFKEFPDSWIKSTIKGNELQIENGQILGYDGDKPTYFHYGTTHVEDSSGNTYYMRWITFNPKNPISFVISKDGNMMYAGGESRLKDGLDYYFNASFWYNDDPIGIDGFTYVQDLGVYATRGEYTYNKFPEKDFMINMCFKKL